jgi:hypothetical protein
MSKSKMGSDLVWVNSTQNGIPNQAVVRAKIRKQAMKHVAATRAQKKFHGNLNVRQYPAYVSDEDSSTGHAVSKVHSHAVAFLSSVPPSISPNKNGMIGFEGRFRVDELAALSITNFRGYNGWMLLQSPGELCLILGRKHQVYFEFLRSRYGNSPCVTDAIDCVAARMQGFVLPATASFEADVAAAYSKALRSLHGALDSPLEGMRTDVLCATELLSVYEVRHIDSSLTIFEHSSLTWLHTAAGSREGSRLEGACNRSGIHCIPERP